MGKPFLTLYVNESGTAIEYHYRKINTSEMGRLFADAMNTLMAGAEETEKAIKASSQPQEAVIFAKAYGHYMNNGRMVRDPSNPAFDDILFAEKVEKESEETK